MICPNITIKEVKDGFNEMVEALGGRPLTDEEFKSSELRNQRTGLDYSAMEAAYRSYHRNNGNMLDKAPNGKDSVLFNSLLEYFEGDRVAAIKAKANVYTDEFFNWFGNWIIPATPDIKNSEDIKSGDISKVVDENGEPMIVWHGGAKDIRIFKNSSEVKATTETGYYTDPNTGEKIPTDSSRTIFFSSNRHVATSYALLYANKYYATLFNRTQSLIGSFYGGKAELHHDYFRSLEDLYEFLDQVSEFNPRFAKLEEYIKKLRSENKRLPENAVNAARELFIKLRSELREYESGTNLVSSQWDDILEKGRKIINKYNNPEGIQRLLDGEIPEQLKKEYELSYKLQQFRIKHGKSENGFLDSSIIWLSSHASFDKGDYRLKYDGKQLYFDFTRNPDELREVPVSKMSKEEIKKFFDDALIGNKESIQERNEDIVKSKYEEKSLMYPVYLNVRNPFLHDYEGTHLGLGYKESDKIPFGYVAARLVNKALKDGNDGVIYQNIYDPYLADNYGVFHPNLVKHVKNLGDFSVLNDDIYLNLSYRNASKDIQDILRSRRLIHNYLGTTYVTKRDGAIEAIQRICANTTVVPLFTPTKNATAVEFIDNCYIAQDLKDEIERSDDKSLLNILSFARILQLKVPQMRFTVIRPTDIPEGVRKDANSFVKGNMVYLVAGRATSETTVEEFMHPIVHTIQNGNTPLFNDLFEEAKKDFPKLWAEIKDTYTDQRGFSAFDRENELVTQAIARYVHSGYKKAQNRTTVKQLIKNVFNFISKLLQHAIEKVGNVHRVDPEKLPKMKLSELAQLIVADDSQFKVFTSEDTKYSIAATHKTDQEIAEGITKRFNVLYRAFEKIPNKSAKRQQTQNKLFELYNELQQHQDLEAVRIALDFGLQSIGTIDSATGTPTNTQSVLGYLDAQSKRTDPFSGITPQVLVDMYSNSIGFYENLLENYIPDQINPRLTQEDRIKIIQLRTSLASAKSLWTQAMVVVGDKIVDQQIDNEVEADAVDKENMKIVAKDWLHKNIMYGDINSFTSYVFNYGYSSNPIIRQAFHLIQGAETKTLAEIHPIAQRVAKAFRKADKGFKSLTYNWLTVLQEHTVDGIPTGNFVRDINYGQYEIDLENFIKELNERFINDYGHTYIDENGVVVNSLTGELADEEEWYEPYIDLTDGSYHDGEPIYIKYLKEIEHWKCEHAHRRYTEAYYMERLSQPYKGSLDPNDVDVNKFGHGLSPKALTRYNHIQSNINYYLDKCTDKDTGLTYPERLNDQDKASLDAWQDALDQLQNPFNEDMTPKTDDERQVAFEIRAWQKWLGEKMTTEINLDDYVAELQRLQAEAAITGNYKIVQDFVRYNSSYGIHPEFIELTIGKFARSHPTDQDVIHAMYYKNALQSAVKTKTGYTRDLEKMENRPEFWLDCKHMDQIIEDGKSKGDPDFAKEFEENFGFDEILYRDAYGRAIDSAGNPVKPEDEGLHNDLLTYWQYMVNKYTNLAYNSPTRTILGLNDLNGNPIVFNGTIDEVREVVEKLFSYRKTKQSGSSLTVEYVPLTIFSMMKPKKDSFVNAKNGRTERTMLDVPRGRFAERFDKSGAYINVEYDRSNLNAEQPRKDYIQDGIARYDNSKEFGRIKGDVKVLYDILIDTMQQAQDAYSTQNRRFNHRLPQIEADGMQLMTRLLNNGFKNTAAALFDSITTVQENDESMRTADDYMTNPDGSVATDVPLKFVRRLKDPSRLTTDVVGSVILFMNMALNYKNKTEIDAQLKTLRFNMDPNFRAGVELEKDEFAPSDNSNSVDMFDSMLNNHMYNNQWTKAPLTGADSRTMVAWKKTMRKVHRLETTQMLALNLFSMIVGFGDSMTRIFKESIMGKYMSLRDSLTSLADIIVRYTIPVIANIGNPVANNKLTRAMQVNGISKGVHQTYEHTNYGRSRKVFYNLLMGGFSMLDWMANALLLRSYYNNIRFYDGGIVPTGFYSAYELKQAFVNAGHTKKEAYLAHMWSTTTLWGAYDNNMQLKPEYEQYVSWKTKTRIRTKTLQRAALYNGMNPDNDLPTYKTKLIGAFVGAMRGWLTQAIEHLFAGGSDNIVRNVHKVYDFQIKRSKTYKYHYTKSDALTDEQRSRRMSWNYETGTPNDQIYIGMARAFNTFNKKLWRYATLNFAKAKEAKFSYVEKYAWRDAIIYLGILALCMVAWPMLNEQAAQVPPPKDREEAGPMSVQDVPRWFNEQYIGDQYWKMLASDIAFRVIEALITSIDPSSAMDVVNSITTLNSGVNEHIGLIKAAGDVLGVSGHSTDEVVKQGGYKYYTRGERNLYKAIGPLDNLQTAFTYYGIKTNQQFYTNTYGGIYRFVGYDFKHEQKLNNGRAAGGRGAGGRGASGRGAGSR